MEIVTSWERRGIEKGLQEGLWRGRLEGRLEGQQEGRQEGRQEGIEALRAVLLDVFTTRFGPPDESVIGQIHNIGSMERLRSLTHCAITADSLHDLGL